MIVSWVLFPLVLAGLGAGWGVLVEKAIGREVQGALLIALGLLAALLAAALLTATKTTAPAAAFVVGATAVAGLAIAWPGRRLSPWPLLAAIAILLAYGAPIVLSGQATFAGYDLLDDTATWLGITDQLFAHARSVTLTPPGSFSHIVDTYLHLTGYPSGAFMLLGVGRGLTGTDAACVFQPYLACCGVLVGLPAYALFERFVASRALRAGLAFVAAQPALLYGYGLWGGIKELTAAWILIAGIALLEPYIGRGAPKPRETLLLALPAAALISTLGAGALAWIAPALLVIAASWGAAARRDRGARALLASCAALVAQTVLLALPALLVISTFLATDEILTATTATPNDADALAGLFAPLSPFQLAGVWPVGDFRLVAPTGPTTILVAAVIAGAVGAIVAGLRRRLGAIALYVAAAVLGVVAVRLAGGSPWVVAKALAIGAPALLAAGLLGGALLMERSRPLGLLLCACLAGGVLWSNALAYHDVRLAPRPRLAELQEIGTMIAGRGPTLINENELYATRHFLRAGAATAPSEHSGAPTALRDGQTLGSVGFADLDAFSLETLLYYRTIVTSRSPTSSRPPSSYRLVWQGRWYELWQRPANPTSLPVLHVPGGDSGVLPYCGTATRGARGRCSIAPASIAPCSTVRRIASAAARAHGRLVAYERPSPIVARASDARIPPQWAVDASTGEVVASRPGTIVGEFRLPAAGRYGVWLGDSFARAIDVSVDGRPQGRVSGQRGGMGTYQYLRTTRLARGRHAYALTLTHPRANLAPGGGGARNSTLLALALDPLDGPRARMLDVSPTAAGSLCGRSLDWIEVVRPSP